MSIFRRRETPTEVLVGSILSAEIERRKADVLIDAERAKIELRKLELEHAHIEEIAEERRKDIRLREELRAAKRESIAAARKKRWPRSPQPDCQVCADPTSIVDVATLSWHLGGHQPQPAQ